MEHVMESGEIVREYLQAFGLHGQKLDFEFLSAVIARHVARSVFSSVGCRPDEELPLAFESLHQRIILRRRGGYCFEQNGLLYRVLEDLGFSPELYLARVVFDHDTHPGLTHRITMVEYERRP